MSWYVVKEIQKPPYEVTDSGPHETEGAAYAVCPDLEEYTVWPRPAQPDRIDEEDQ